jgi:hypothetical protein
MPTNINKVIQELCETTQGLFAHKKVEKLYKQALQGDEKSFQGLLTFMQSGKLDHIRTHVSERLLTLITAQRSELLVDTFRRGLTDDALRYWSIEGLAQVAGSNSYRDLLAIALDGDCKLDERAKAIQTLARTSRQPFNRGLNRDPGRWALTDFRLEELKSWRDAGFPQGVDLPKAVRDPALDNPQTEFEKVIAEFDFKLAQYRANDPDEETCPSNYLAAASSDDMKAIMNKWSLPKNYLIFLERFSPHNMTCCLQLKSVSEELDLYSASTILEMQGGYAFNSLTGEGFENWPANYVVIGNLFWDPLIYDLSMCDKDDGPIFVAPHGEAEWDFSKYAKSFESLIQELKVS